MDGIRPMSSPWPGVQGRSTILPPSSVIQSGPYHGSAVLTTKLKVNLIINFLMISTAVQSRLVVIISYGVWYLFEISSYKT